MKNRKRRNFTIVSIAVVMLAAVGAATLLYKNSRFELQINGEQIEKDAYLMCMELVEYDTEMQIQQQYDAKYGEDFWEMEYDGKYGYEILAENSIEKLKHIQAVYKLAEQYGDVPDGSFEAVKSRWEAENASRAEKVANNEVIYGLKEYTFELYLQYELSMCKEAYCNDYDREDMELTEEEIQEYYSNGEWIFGESEEKADLETARVAVEREMREKRYDDKIAHMMEDSKVDGDRETVNRFTLKHIEK